jgi:hypothetical protein
VTEPAPQEERPGEGSAAAGVVPARPWWRPLALAAGGLLAVLLPLALRVALEGRAELAAADQARAQGDLAGEIEHLGRALRWRMPGRDHDEAALERLWALGQAQEARGAEGRATALAAYRELRDGLLATRAWGVPHRERWAAANLRIAALMAEEERALGTDVSGTGDPEAFHHALLASEPGPDPTRANLAALAFVGWVVGVAGMLVGGLDARGRLRPRAALRWGVVAVLCLLAWTVLLAGAHG